MAGRNNIEDHDLERVSGGSYFSNFSKEEYKDAGVEIIKPGLLWNGGYKFRGRKISNDDASALVYFYQEFGRKAGSVQEAVDWYEDENKEQSTSGQ